VPGERATDREAHIAAKEDFLTFVHDRVFVPLKMPDTTADENATVVASRARWYALAPDGSYRNSSYADLSYK
jgi:CubicO group peptidase (beta-lactamase class C family)